MFSQSKNGTSNRRLKETQVRKPKLKSNHKSAADSMAAAKFKPAIASKKTVRRHSDTMAKKKASPQVKSKSEVAPKAKALLGQWKVLAASQKGKQASKRALDQMSVTFESDKFVIQIGDRQEVAKFKLGDSDKLPQINIMSNREGVKASAGIYELNDDKLIICWSAPGRPRPTRFINFVNVKSLVLERQ